MMVATILQSLTDFEGLLSSPVVWLVVLFQLWMLVDAIKRGEWIWAVLIFIFSGLTAILYFFFVYHQSGGRIGPTSGFELPGSYERKRIKELEASIHHLDKAHHYSQLGDIYFQQGKLPKAEGYYREAMKRDAEDIDTRAHLGQCLLRQGKLPEAREFLEKVCAEDPRHDYGHSLMALAEVQTALKEPDRAIQTWRRVLESHSYARARVQLAELLIAKGTPAEAKSILQEVIIDDAHAPRFQRNKERVWVKRAQSMIKSVPAAAQG